MLSEELLKTRYHGYQVLSEYIKKDEINVVIDSVAAENTIALNTNGKLPLFYNVKEKIPQYPTGGLNINGNITSIALSPCGSYAATGNDKGQLILWDTTSKCSIVDLTIEPNVQICSISFLGSIESLIATTQNSKIHIIDISTLLLFKFMKVRTTLDANSPVLQICYDQSIDKSVQFFATAEANKVFIYNSLDSYKIMTEFSCSKPKITFISDDWHFYLAIAEENHASVYKVYENGDYEQLSTFNFQKNIKKIYFISTILIGIYTEGEIIFVNINGEICKTISDFEEAPLSVCATQQKIMLLPYGVYVVEDFIDCINRLNQENRFAEAAAVAVSVYSGNSSIYSCSNNWEILREKLKVCLLMLANSSFPLSQFPLVAECIVKGDVLDSFSDIVDQLKSNEDKLKFCMDVLKCDSGRPEVTEMIFPKLKELNPIGNNIVEDALLNSPITPSYLQKAVPIAINLHFNRFLLHTFDRFFGEILPAFALIVENGCPKQIAELCEYVFLGNIFDESKTNICAVWLHAPGKGRLESVASASWEGAYKIIAEFIRRAPIRFSSNQKLTAQDMIRAAFLCFNCAKSPDADDLFTLVATESINQGVPVPPSAVESIIKYIFESSASRTIRESLMLRIVDIDYNGIDITKFKYHCVRAGFACIVNRIAPGDDDLGLRVQSRLLSDTPEEAIDLLAQFSGDSDKAQATLTNLFVPLLHLNPEKLVKLVLSKFKSLHPLKIPSHSRGDTKLYFDTLFNIEPPIVTPEDTTEYLRILNERHDIKHILHFLRTAHNLNTNNAYEFCSINRIYIGCAVINAASTRYTLAFEDYRNHIQTGAEDMELTQTLLENIESISFPPPVVLRTLFEPLVNRRDLLEQTVQSALAKLPESDVLVAMFSLLLMCGKAATVDYIRSFVSSHAILISVSDTSETEVLESLCRMTAKCNTYSDGVLSVRDYDIGVVALKTEPKPREAHSMDKQLASIAHTVMQRAEVQLMIHKITISPNENPTIILLTE